MTFLIRLNFLVLFLFMGFSTSRAESCTICLACMCGRGRGSVWVLSFQDKQNYTKDSIVWFLYPFSLQPFEKSSGKKQEPWWGEQAPWFWRMLLYSGRGVRKWTKCLFIRNFYGFAYTVKMGWEPHMALWRIMMCKAHLEGFLLGFWNAQADWRDSHVF